MPGARRWHWYTCPRCFNDRAGTVPGEERITGELVQAIRPTYAATASRPAQTLTWETWRLSCPCGHGWEVTRQKAQDGP